MFGSWRLLLTGVAFAARAARVASEDDRRSNQNPLSPVANVSTVGGSYLDWDPKSGGTLPWADVEDLSRSFAKGLVASPMSLARMKDLISFLVAVPERARAHMAEAAAAVLLKGGLADSASCLFSNVASASPDDSVTTDFLYRRSLDIVPRNRVTVRSFGFKLQSQGRADDALRLYNQQLQLDPAQPILYLMRASVCPHHFNSVRDSLSWYETLREKLTESLVLLRGLRSASVADLHLSLHQHPGRAWQYLGLPIAPLIGLLNKNLLVMDSGLASVARGLGTLSSRTLGEIHERVSNESAGHSAVGEHAGSDGWRDEGKRLRIGIVLERRANASPERVFAAVLKELDRRLFEVVVFAQDTPHAPPGVDILNMADQVVLLPGHATMGSVSESASAGGGKVVSLGLPMFHASREVIAAEKLDCILYLALGASLLQHLLSMARLAPLQLSFGLGHPVTSGHEAIDYFVSSTLFEMPHETEHRGRCRSERAQAQAAEVPFGADGGVGSTGTDFTRQDELSPLPTPTPSSISWCGPMIYSEQVVLFDSYTGAFVPPTDPSPERVIALRRAIVSAATGASEENASPIAGAIPDWARGSGGNHGDTSQTIASSHGAAKGGGPGKFGSPPNRRDELDDSSLADARVGVRLYHCIQDAKKFHPAFDEAMAGVLEADPGARLLLPAAAKVHSQRWTSVFGPGGAGRLLFLSEMEHPFTMEVVAACDVMLAPWGWGAGITSFEALALGVPVVTLPSRESVLHFAMGQISLLGLEDELVAKDASDYVSKAIRLANDRPFREALSARILSKRDELFGRASAVAVASEWGAFIERGVRLVHSGSPAGTEEAGE